MISVIVPVYNAEKYLVRSLDSVKQQSYSDYEVIVIDDGSTDGSYSIIESYCNNDKRFKSMKTSHVGASKARNMGVNSAEGDYILFLDADDELDDQYLEHVNSAIEKTSADVCFCTLHKKNESGEVSNIDVVRGLGEATLFTNREFLHKCVENNSMIPASMCLLVIKKTFLSDNNIHINEDMTWSEDSDYAFNIWSKADSITVCNYPGYTWHINSTSLSNDVSMINIYSRLDFYKNWTLYFRDNLLQDNRYNRDDVEWVINKLVKDYFAHWDRASYARPDCRAELIKRLKEDKGMWSSYRSKRVNLYNVLGVKLAQMLISLKDDIYFAYKKR